MELPRPCGAVPDRLGAGGAVPDRLGAGGAVPDRLGAGELDRRPISS
jgi:hypothetical protein